MPCDFEQQAANTHRCRRCGAVVESSHSPARIRRRCPAGGDAPGVGRRAWNVLRAAAAFVADGLRTVTAEEYHARLAICDTCPQRRDDTCAVCGCRLTLKARGRAWRCPLGKWQA
jgi:hypothetical protein